MDRRTCKIQRGHFIDVIKEDVKLAGMREEDEVRRR